MPDERKFSAGAMPTPGPWLVRGAADEGASPVYLMLRVEPPTDDVSGGLPYLIRLDRPYAAGECPLHLAIGIQHLADARLRAVAPDPAEMLLRLLTAPNLTATELDPQTRTMVDTAWTLLVQAAPHLAI